MDKHSVDFDTLAHTLLPERTHRLADVEHRLEKVAFDVVRFRDNQDTDMLWKVQDTSDGPVIVALYDENNGSLVTESNSQTKTDWEAVPDKKGASVHLFYKSEPVIKIKASDAGIPADEVDMLARWLPRKLETDASLQSAVLSKMAKDNRDLFVGKHPELDDVAKSI